MVSSVSVCGGESKSPPEPLGLARGQTLPVHLDTVSSTAKTASELAQRQEPRLGCRLGL
jgi:hypothetical protein